MQIWTFAVKHSHFYVQPKLTGNQIQKMTLESEQVLNDLQQRSSMTLQTDVTSKIDQEEKQYHTNGCAHLQHHSNDHLYLQRLVLSWSDIACCIRRKDSTAQVPGLDFSVCLHHCRLWVCSDSKPWRGGLRVHCGTHWTTPIAKIFATKGRCRPYSWNAKPERRRFRMGKRAEGVDSRKPLRWKDVAVSSSDSRP